jgi:hypothetical protein
LGSEPYQEEYRTPRIISQASSGSSFMNGEIDGLLERLRQIEDELEQRFEARRAAFRYEIKKRRAVFEASAVARHRQIKIGILRFLRKSPVQSILTAPFIYALVIPLALLDLSVCLFQLVCFPVWGIARVRRSEHIAIDRQYLAYLNGIQKLNCVYCGYANGLIAFSQEVACRTEQYWCPIKHARRVKNPHHRYKHFLDFGDAEGFRDKQDEFRKKLK